MQAAEQQTGQALQDVNIAQQQQLRRQAEIAGQQQFQSRQAELQRAFQGEQAAAERGLQRFGIEQQQQTAQRGQDIEQAISQAAERGATTRQQEELAGRIKLQELAGAQNLDQLRLTQAFAKAESALDRNLQSRLTNLQLDTQRELANAQLAFDQLSLSESVKQFNKQFGFNEEQAQTANALAQSSQDLQREAFNHAVSQDNAELAINKMVTAVNLIPALIDSGFTNGDVATVLADLDLGIGSNTLSQVLDARHNLLRGIEIAPLRSRDIEG